MLIGSKAQKGAIRDVAGRTSVTRDLPATSRKRVELDEPDRERDKTTDYIAQVDLSAERPTNV